MLDYKKEILKMVSEIDDNSILLKIYHYVLVKYQIKKENEAERR